MPDLEPYPEKGKPPRERIKDAAALRCLFEQFRQADELSSKNRVIVQSCVDGAPPYNQDALRLSGAGYRHNLNFGLSSALLRAALTAYTDLIDSVDTLAYTWLPTTVGDPTIRSDWEQTIAEEFHRMLRDWSEFDSVFQTGVVEMVSHGVGWVTWPFDEDWKWRAGGWDDFLIARRTAACEESVDVMISRESMPLHKLFRKIEDEKAASDMGYTVEACKKALVRATTSKNDLRGWSQQWSALQKELKNNDLTTSYASAQGVKVIHGWVRSFNGEYSHYMAEEDCGEDYLFKKLDRFPKATSAFVALTNETPQNSTYHGIRGLLYSTFPAVQTINRLRCSVLDGTLISNTLMLQPDDATALEEPPMTVNGPVSFLNPAFKAVDVKFQNPGRESLEIINDLSNLVKNQTPSYRSGGANPGGEKTKFELQLSSALESSLSVSAVGLFYQSWKRVLAEVFRRVAAIRPTDAGFPEVKAFYERCEQRGVTADIVKKVNRVEPVKAVGYGSASQRLAAFNELLGVIGSLDPIGRNAAMRDALSARFGREKTDRYLPRIEQPRPIIDEKIAELENSALRNDANIQALDGEDHFMHATIHFNAMFSATEVWEKLRLEQNLDFERIGPELQFVQNGLGHVKQHIEAMQADTSREAEFKGFRQAFQQLNGVWMGFVASYTRYLRDNRRQSEDETPDPNAPQQDAATIAKQREHELKLAQMREAHYVRTGLKAEEIQQTLDGKRMLNDLEAADMVRKNAIKAAG